MSKNPFFQQASFKICYNSVVSDLFLLNSLSRKKEKFIPLKEGKAGIYCPAPTVYSFATIGNFRTYTLADILVRTLKQVGLEVTYVMNITDVGHLTGDTQGNADLGEDRIEKAAKKEEKNAWDIAKFYTERFVKDYKKLELTKPNSLVKATDHLKEQIELVKKLEEKGFTYKTSDGIYFDTAVFEEKTGKKYGELSRLDVIKRRNQGGAQPGKEKPERLCPRGNFSKGEKRKMEWDSPWGIGFPGWHIECSAMSMKYLGKLSTSIPAGTI